MKTFRILSLSVITLVGAAFASAQTAEEIIGKYVDAIGGKDQVNQITSLYTEGTMDAMGNQGTIKTTLLNGKAFKSEIDVMGTQVTFCITDSTGWQINPMSGNYSAETMSVNQYNASKDQIFIGGPFVDYATKGYQVELVGQEMVADINANKLRVVSADNVETFYYFDPATNYLIKLVQKGEMMGQPMDIIIAYAKYQKTDNGYTLPYTIETNYGGQFFLVTNITKVDINQTIDPAIFVKP